jgi:co-chaperonin GroES (HSP10)
VNEPHEQHPSASRPRHHQARQGRGEEQGRDHHPRHGEGEADRGRGLAVGNGKVHEDGTVRKLDVKVGDRVLFGKYSGTEVKIDGEDRLILREDDILGVLEK